MAGQRLTDKALFTGNLATDDLLMVVDTSDTTGSSLGTSKKVTNDQIIQTTKVNISSANFAAMDDTGVAGTFFELLPAPGTGLFYVILNITINTLVTSAPSNNTDLLISYDSTSTADFIASLRRFAKTQPSASYQVAPGTFTKTGGDLGTLTTKPLLVYANQNFNGSFSADFYVTYRKCAII
tara:strand:+ start:386 stop:931 length:546 start_codon:yes stop_codon:yes gene_type:complete